MKNILYYIISLLDNNWGYSTHLQKRYTIGDVVKIGKHRKSDTPFYIGESVTIVETGRHDYLVRNERGISWCIYQFEISCE